MSIPRENADRLTAHAAGTAAAASEARPLRVVLLSGIYPPDIGGPATHVVDLARELSERGHRTTVISLCDGPRTLRLPGLIRFPRRWPWPLRSAAVAGWLALRREDYDVVYATGLQPEGVLGARLARRPVVVKIVGDPAWERGRRLGLTTQEFVDFQRSAPDGLRLRAMRLLRDWSVRAATKVVVPSAFLATCVEGWTGHVDVAVIPNGVRRPPEARVPRPRQVELTDLLVVSRLTEHKCIDVLIEAVAGTPGVTLEVIGEGPDRERLENLAERLGAASRVHFVGSMSHDAVLLRLAEADALVSASSYEGLPHVLIEALSVGTPVISSPAGGVPEVLDGGTGGVIVDPPTADGFARTLARLRAQPEKLVELRQGALALGRQWQFSTAADGVERLLVELTV
jgi:glycosyltransferase involved in cell wall biosynthesis